VILTDMQPLLNQTFTCNARTNYFAETININGFYL
jgi:hypothetical protein